MVDQLEHLHSSLWCDQIKLITTARPHYTYTMIDSMLDYKCIIEYNICTSHNSKNEYTSIEIDWHNSHMEIHVSVQLLDQKRQTKLLACCIKGGQTNEVGHLRSYEDTFSRFQVFYVACSLIEHNIYPLQLNTRNDVLFNHIKTSLT